MSTFITIYLVIGAIIAGIETFADVSDSVRDGLIKSEYYESSSQMFWTIIVLTGMSVIRFALWVIVWPIIAVVKIKEVFTEVF